MPKHHAYFIEDIRRLVSLVNWHLWFRLEHSEQAAVSVASHYEMSASGSPLRRHQCVVL
jgi:hypothetical protein